MKRRGIASPDLADALAITFGAAVIRRDAIERMPWSADPAEEWNKYNPLGL